MGTQKECVRVCENAEKRTKRLESAKVDTNEEKDKKKKGKERVSEEERWKKGEKNEAKERETNEQRDLWPIGSPGWCNTI